MTSREKAEELFNKFYKEAPYQEIEFYSNDVMARQCALLAVDEIIKAFYLNIFSDIVGNNVINFSERESNYWEDVKQEILNL